MPTAHFHADIAPSDFTMKNLLDLGLYVVHRQNGLPGLEELVNLAASLDNQRVRLGHPHPPILQRRVVLWERGLAILDRTWE